MRLEVRPLTTAVYAAANFRGFRLARKTAGEYAEVRAAGGDVFGVPDLFDAFAFAGSRKSSRAGRPVGLPQIFIPSNPEGPLGNPI